MQIGATGVQSDDLLDDFYGPLLEFLALTHRVEIVPYDWRLSIREAAKHLIEKLREHLPEAERNYQPVHLIAHSMGFSRKGDASGWQGRCCVMAAHC